MSFVHTSSHESLQQPRGRTNDLIWRNMRLEEIKSVLVSSKWESEAWRWGVPDSKALDLEGSYLMPPPEHHVLWPTMVWTWSHSVRMLHMLCESSLPGCTESISLPSLNGVWRKEWHLPLLHVSCVSLVYGEVLVMTKVLFIHRGRRKGSSGWIQRISPRT